MPLVLAALADMAANALLIAIAVFSARIAVMTFDFLRGVISGRERRGRW